MKLKRIKCKADLKAGNYIRAYLSPNGSVHINYVMLTGKPYKSKGKYDKGSWVMNGNDSLSKLVGKSWHFSSLSDELYPPVLSMRNGIVNKVLVKFTPSAYKYLKGFCGELRINDFLVMLNKRELTYDEINKQYEVISEFARYREYYHSAPRQLTF